MLEPEIFIQIASYRDPELPLTLRDLIGKARHPQRLRLGICLEINAADESICGPSALPQGEALRGAELRLDCSAAELSQGCCPARSRTQKLWRREPFTLQIDSHMRFMPDWDEELLAMWRRCGDERAVITSYPNAFQPPDQYSTELLPLLAALHFDEDGVLRFRGINTYRIPDQLPSAPPPGALASGCMLFGPAAMIEAAPYDPQLYFYGEEISLAVRLWTHGFNLYNPDRLLMFHFYKSPGSTHNTHWADHPDWSALNRRSVKRVRSLLLGEELPAPFGLGTARSLESWQVWSGVDFARQTISAEARLGRFSSPPPCELPASAFPG